MKKLPSSDLVSGTILNSPKRLERLARTAGWLVRSPKKLTPILLVRGLLAAVLKGERSLRELAHSVGMRLDPKSNGAFDTISKTALWERVGEEAVVFLRSVLAQLVRECVLPSKPMLPTLSGVGRIIVEDSCALALDPRHVGDHPACGNQHADCAGMRLQAAFDLLTGDPLRLELTKYRRNDQRASGDILELLRPRDLLVRDLGYFSGKSFAAILEKQAYYLTRYFSGTTLCHAEKERGGRIDLLQHLSKHAPAPGDIVDLDVVVGSGQKGVPRFEGRLVARRVPKPVEAKRLRRLGEQERHRKKKFNKTHRKLQGWEIYITSLPREQVTAAKIFAIYPLRWRIEIIFKACKSHSALNDLGLHRSNINHVQALLHTWLCALVLATRTGAFALATEGESHVPRPNCLSLLKVVSKVFVLLSELMSATCAPFSEIMDRWRCQTNYHDRYELRRKRKNMTELLAAALELDPGVLDSGTKTDPLT